MKHDPKVHANVLQKKSRKINTSPNSERQRMKGPLMSDSDCNTHCLRWQDERVNDSTMTGWIQQQNGRIQMKPGRHDGEWQRKRWTPPCSFSNSPPQGINCKILGKLQWHILETDWMSTFYIHIFIIYIFTRLYISSTFGMIYIVSAQKFPLVPRRRRPCNAVNGL